MNRSKHWMPLWIGDYLADTAQLNGEQHGCYLLLLMSQWRVGSIPDDPDQLAQICHLSAKYYGRSIRPVLERYFRLYADGTWRNAKCAELKEAAEIKVNKANIKAREAAILRWHIPEPKS